MDYLDVRQLRAFVSVAQSGSFTQAARDLHLTQSAVSHAIKSLEEDIGCELFTKSGRKAILNQAGETLLRSASKILNQMNEARSEIKRLQEWGSGRIRIGASTTTCQYLLPNVLREFKECFPKYSISVIPSDGPQCLKLLEENQLDLALTLQPWMDERFDYRHIFHDELSFIASPLHPWSQAGKANPSDIATQHYILYPRGSYTFEMIDSHFRKEGVVLKSFIELGSMEAIKELVKIGLGVGILAPWIASREIREKSLVAIPLGKHKLKRNWGISFIRGKTLSLAEETFYGLCKTVTENL